MFSSLRAGLLAASPARLSNVTRVVPANVLTRAILSSQSRLLLTSARLQSPAKSTGSTKATTSKSKAPAKKKPAAKKEPAKKAAAPKKEKKKPVEKKPSFDSKLMKPPKRPASAYFLFNGERIRASAPKTIVEASGMIKQNAQEWKTLPAAAKQVYTDKANLLRANYPKAYEEWYLTLPPGYFREINKRRIAKGKPKFLKPKTLPRPPGNAWVFFCNDYRKRHGYTGAISEYLPNAREEWKVMTESEKVVYQRQARDAREEFQKQQQAAK
ncbi:hypothetical protein D9758_005665 [Tetrapyrgos nigripes]|uniref:HMG box domain-containing protein n=1 Tax=Tetrapyrgos nigripes TaxID=182062 RepID=A0A8H5LQI0_9AGAR|nr:hypothetical protein D9758_005665 [Tetrapyrgos nigripes]